MKTHCAKVQEHLKPLKEITAKKLGIMTKFRVQGETQSWK